MSSLPYIYEKVTLYLVIAPYYGLTTGNTYFQAEPLIMPFREWQQTCIKGILWT